MSKNAHSNLLKVNKMRLYWTDRALTVNGLLVFWCGEFLTCSDYLITKLTFFYVP